MGIRAEGQAISLEMLVNNFYNLTHNVDALELIETSSKRAEKYPVIFPLPAQFPPSFNHSTKSVNITGRISQFVHAELLLFCGSAKGTGLKSPCPGDCLLWETVWCGES